MILEASEGWNRSIFLLTGPYTHRFFESVTPEQGRGEAGCGRARRRPRLRDAGGGRVALQILFSSKTTKEIVIVITRLMKRMKTNLCSIGPCVVLVCTVWYTAVCSSVKLDGQRPFCSAGSDEKRVF